MALKLLDKLIRGEGDSVDQTLLKLQKAQLDTKFIQVLKPLLTRLVESYEKTKKELQDYVERRLSPIEQQLSKATNELNKANSTIGNLEGLAEQSANKALTQARKEIEAVKKMLRNEMPDNFDASALEARLDSIENQFTDINRQLVHAIPVDDAEGLRAEIKRLEEQIDGIKSIPRSKPGGGVNAKGVRHAFQYIANTEAPVGDIDGVNTTYTVQKEIYFVMGFMLNGEQIAELPNFTYEGKTITFSTALPAVYSGKDFEIKYIG